MKLKLFKAEVILVLLTSIILIPFLGRVHLFDWDEINFAECAREMIVSGDYSLVQINFQPFWEKPPLFIWMQVVCMKVFGVNEFSARFPNVICGLITLLFLFRLGKRIYSESFGIIWVLTYMGAILPQLYFKSGIIDPWFNLFIFSGIYYFVLFLQLDQSKTEITRNLILSSSLIGLAVLTKGPVGLLIPAFCLFVYAISKFSFRLLTSKQLFVYTLVVAVIGGSYFLLLLLEGRSQVVLDFIDYQIRLFKTEDSGHGGPFIYHFVVLLLGCFPASIFALSALKFSNGGDSSFAENFRRWMLILFWVVLLLFSIVKTKIVHYSSLCYFPLSFLSAYGVYKISRDELIWKKYQSVLMLIIGVILSLALTTVSFIELFKNKLIVSDKIHDQFALENLSADVNWIGIEWLPGLILFVSLIVFFVFLKRKVFYSAFISLSVLMVIVVNLASVFIVPQIEKYSQNAAIEFYIGKSKENCVVETYGFKSYAHLFYSNKRSNSISKDDIFNGKNQTPAYVVSKINHVPEIQSNLPHWKELYRKNGFVFWQVQSK